jgi:hypothetical protein
VITEKTVLVECRTLDDEGEIFIDGRLWTDLSVIDRLDLLSDWIGGLTRVYDSVGLAIDAELLEERERSNIVRIVKREGEDEGEDEDEGEEKGNG